MFQEATELFKEGGFVMVPLLLCSIVGLTVVIERSIYFFRRRLRSDRPGLLKFLDLVRKGSHTLALDLASKSKDDLVKTAAQGLNGSESELKSVFEMTYSEGDRGMSRFMMVLDTIITLSPLLGILGTVLGIIESFELLGEEGARDPMAVTGGIAKALITTAAGLSIAIIMLIPFNFFRSKIDTALNEIEEVGTFMETYRRKKPGEDS